jgi:DNA adenine methylase
LADTLKALKRKFLLSINDHKEIRRLFARFTIETVPISYSLHGIAGKRHQELLISNYKQTKTGSSGDDPAG